MVFLSFELRFTLQVLLFYLILTIVQPENQGKSQSGISGIVSSRKARSIRVIAKIVNVAREALTIRSYDALTRREKFF